MLPFRANTDIKESETLGGIQEAPVSSPICNAGWNKYLLVVNFLLWHSTDTPGQGQDSLQPQC